MLLFLIWRFLLVNVVAVVVVVVLVVDLCPVGTVFGMLLDLADCSTIDQCQQLFAYVEQNISHWKSVSCHTFIPYLYEMNTK